MKIYSWNVNCLNKNLDAVFEFIRTREFDVMCLQEVPEALLQRLRKLPYSCVSHVDFRRLSSKNAGPYHVAILTPHKMISGKSFFVSRGLSQPLRTKVLIRLMRVFGWSEIEDRGAIYADINLPNSSQILRIFSAHLRNDGPRERRKEFDILAKHLVPGQNAIVCGDLNIIDPPLLKMFNWAMGSSLLEGMPWYPERKIAEQTFGALGLQNPLYKKHTHTIFPSQLDHILIPQDWRVKHSEILYDSMGSDHYPILIEALAL